MNSRLKHINKDLSNLRTLIRVSAALLAVAPMSQAADTGFNPTDAGSYDYNTTANWVSAPSLLHWDTSITLAAVQAVTFDAHTTLIMALTFNNACD